MSLGQLNLILLLALPQYLLHLNHHNDLKNTVSRLNFTDMIVIDSWNDHDGEKSIK